MNTYQEERTYNHFRLENLVGAMIVGVLLMIAFSLITIFITLELVHLIFLGLITLVIYGISLFFLLEPEFYTEVNTVRNEGMIREIYVDRPVIVEKPVIREVVREVPTVEYREVVKPVYIQKARKKLNIPKYEYIGSTETRTFHARNCRFSKLIKKKYKVSNDSKIYFSMKKFKPCKMCLKKKKN